MRRRSIGLGSSITPPGAVRCGGGLLEQAIELDPLSPPIIADLALVHAFRDDFDAAAMYCRRALELDPHFHRPFWFLGLSSAWNGNFQVAEEALKRGLERCPGAAFRSRLLGASVSSTDNGGSGSLWATSSGSSIGCARGPMCPVRTGANRDRRWQFRRRARLSGTRRGRAREFRHFPESLALVQVAQSGTAVPGLLAQSASKPDVTVTVTAGRGCRCGTLPSGGRHEHARYRRDWTAGA